MLSSRAILARPFFLRYPAHQPGVSRLSLRMPTLPLYFGSSSAPQLVMSSFGQIVAIADGIAVEELRNQLELLLRLRIDPNLLQRPAGNGIEAQRLVAGEQVARLLPRDDLFHRNWLQQPGVPERRIAIGVGLVGVIVLVAAGEPLGDHRREPGHFAGRLVPGAPLEFRRKRSCTETPRPIVRSWRFVAGAFWPCGRSSQAWRGRRQAPPTTVSPANPPTPRAAPVLRPARRTSRRLIGNPSLCHRRLPHHGLSYFT